MKRLSTLLMIVAAICISGCGEASVVTVTQAANDSVRGLIPQQPDYPGDPGTTDYPKGATATVGSHTETIIDVQYPFTGKYYRNKQPGSSFIKVTVKITNTSDHPIDYNPNFYKLEDSRTVQINYGSFQLEDPLGSGTLPVGGQVVGSMAYEVPEGAEPVALLAEQGHKLPPTRFSVR